jgi:regulator of cell morphogenesis and NO signaling
MEINGSMRIGDIATLVPVSIPVFERYGVDFYHNGDRPLVEALTETGLSVGDILAEIESAIEARETEDRLHADWSQTAPDTLADHILENHHGYLALQLPQVAVEFTKVLLAWGDANDELFEVARNFDILRRGLESHLAMEEQYVFPLLKELGQESPDGMHGHAHSLSVKEKQTLGDRLNVLEEEHAAALGALRSMRAHASDFLATEDTCVDCPVLYEALVALEADIHRHIQLEDEVLLPTIRRLAGL